MVRSKNYKKKNVYNLKKSRQYKHLGGNTCNLKITAKKNIDIILPEDFKKKDFFEIEYNQKLYRIVWDISWFDKQLNKGTYSFLIYTTTTNNNFNIETPEKIKSIDFLVDKMKIIFEKNTINCLTKMLSILSQSKDDVFKDNVFTHLRNKLQLVIANSRTSNFDNNKKRRDNLIIYRNQLFVCKIRKEYPDIYNKLIATDLKDLTIFNNLNTDLDLAEYNTSIGSLAARIKECNASPSTTNSQAKLIDDLQKKILELQNQSLLRSGSIDGQIPGSNVSGNSVNDVCKSKEIEIYKTISNVIYEKLLYYLITLGKEDSGLINPGESHRTADEFKKLTDNNFLVVTKAIQKFITDTQNKTVIAPSSAPAMTDAEKRNLRNYEKLRMKVSELLNMIRQIEKSPSHSNEEICKRQLPIFQADYLDLKNQIREIVPAFPG